MVPKIQARTSEMVFAHPPMVALDVANDHAHEGPGPRPLSRASTTSSDFSLIAANDHDVYGLISMPKLNLMH